MLGFRLLTVVMTVACLPAEVGAAQTSVGASLEVPSSYVWRGLTLANRVVIQPEAHLTVPVAGGRTQVGLWTTIEPLRYDGPEHISSVDGLLPGPAFTDYTAWLEYARDLGPWRLTAGASGFIYPTLGGVPNPFNTIELYGSVQLNAPLVLGLTYDHDLIAVRGGYLEFMASHDLSPAGIPLTVGAETGISLGQETDPRGADAAYFTRRGVSHWSAWAGTGLTLGAFSISPYVQLIRGIDRATRRRAPGVDGDYKLLAALSLSWQTVITGRPE